MMSWTEYLEEKYAPKTVKEYQREVRVYLGWVGGQTRALGADYATIIGYVAYLRKHYECLASPTRKLAAVKAYYRYLLCSGQRSDHPAANLSLRSTQPRRGAIQLQNLLNAEELRSLLDAPSSYYGIMAGRAVPIIGLLVHQALCPREIVGLRVTSVDLKAGTVSVPESTRTAGRTLPLAGSQVMALHHYLTVERLKSLRPERPTDRLFLTLKGGEEQKQGVDKIVRKLRPVLDGKAATPVLIRQSVIAGKLSRGEGLRQVQVFAGHKKVSTTERYRETNLEELRRAVERYHPLATQ